MCATDVCLLVFFELLVAGCHSPLQNNKPFERGKSLGTNKNAKLEEASGLAASAINPGYLWTHNDSGNPAKLFLLDEKARTIKEFKFANIRNRDWEDIALGSGPEENVNYLYLGDIGDNAERYRFKYIYRTREPALDEGEVITNFDTLIVGLPDGIHDSEALMSDPLSKNLYLLSKRESNVAVYEITYPFDADTLFAKKMCTIPYTNITAACISADGNEVLIKNYEAIYYWKRKGDEQLVELLKTPATELLYDRELQGESIAWARDGSGFFTLGENAKGVRSKLYFYKRK